MVRYGNAEPGILLIGEEETKSSLADAASLFLVPLQRSMEPSGAEKGLGHVLDPSVGAVFSINSPRRRVIH